METDDLLHLHDFTHRSCDLQGRKTTGSMSPLPCQVFPLKGVSS